MSAFKSQCDDCDAETDCQRCNICRVPLCQLCDPLHSCLAKYLDSMTEEEAEDLALDAEFEASDDEDSGHA